MNTKSGKPTLALAAFLALLAGRAGAQTTYYVDAAQPDDTCDGPLHSSETAHPARVGPRSGSRPPCRSRVTVIR